MQMGMVPVMEDLIDPGLHEASERHVDPGSSQGSQVWPFFWGRGHSCREILKTLSDYKWLRNSCSTQKECFDMLLNLTVWKKIVLFSSHIGYAGEYNEIHAAVCLVFLAQCSFVFFWWLFDRPSIWNTVSLKNISPMGKILLGKHGIRLRYFCKELNKILYWLW